MGFIQHYIDVALIIAPSQAYILVGSALLSLVMASFLGVLHYGALKEARWLVWLALILVADAVLSFCLAWGTGTKWGAFAKVILWCIAAFAFYRAMDETVLNARNKRRWYIAFFLGLVVVMIEVVMSKYPWHRVLLALWVGSVLTASVYQIHTMIQFWFRQWWKKVALIFLVLGGWFVFLMACVNPMIVLTQNNFPWHGDGIDAHLFPLLGGLDLVVYGLLGFFKLFCFLFAVGILFRMLNGVSSESGKTEDHVTSATTGLDVLLGKIGRELGGDYIELTIPMSDGGFLWHGWFSSPFLSQLSRENWKGLNSWQEKMSLDESGIFKKEFYDKIIAGEPLVIQFDATKGCLHKLYSGGVKDKVYGHCERFDYEYLPFMPMLKTFMAVPVYYQGAIVGTLGIESMGNLPIGPILEQRLRNFGRSLATSIEILREMRAINDFVDQMERSLTTTKSLNVLVGTVVSEIQNFLGVKAVGFQTVLGCARLFAFRKGDDLQIRSLAIQADGTVQDGDSFAEFVGVCKDMVRHENPLEFKYIDGDDVKTHLIGSLHLALDPDAKVSAASVLVSSKFFRKSIADYLANLILRIVRMDFQNRLQEYWNALFKPACTLDTWFEETIKLFHGNCGIYARGEVFPFEMGEPKTDELDFRELGEFQEMSAGDGFKVFQKGSLQVLCIELPFAGVLFVCHRVGSLDISFRLQGSPWKQLLEEARRINVAFFERLNQSELQTSLLLAERDAIRGVVQNLWLHELKNVATRLNMMAYEAKEGGSQDQMPLLDQLYQESQNFGKIANDLNKPLAAEDKDTYMLSELVEPIKRYLDFPLSKYGISLSLVQDLRIVRFNFTVLHLVVMNLVNNAIEALKGQSTRDIVVSASGQCIWVTDSGPGIPATLRGRLFQPGASTSKSHSGVGLAGCRQLLRAHQADLYFDPEYTHGTRFKVQLPKA